MSRFSLDLTIVDQYADFFSTLVWTAGGSPVSYAGATATMMARVSPGDASPVISISTTPSAQGGIFLGPYTDGFGNAVPAGGVELWIAKAALGSSLTAPLYQFDVLLTWANGRVEDLWSGYLRLHFGNNH